jgi:acyl-CoA dehydrogenase
MRRDIFTQDHEQFRAQFRRFAECEIEPRIAAWNAAGMCDKEAWRRMGAQGFLGATVPTEYGGTAAGFLYDVIVIEELARIRAHPLLTLLHCDICMPYLIKYGTQTQKLQHLTAAVRGETILGICMTEPSGGSDLAALKTSARRDGDHFVLNGSKIFITLGHSGTLFIVAARTDPQAERPHRGISLFLVEADTPGFVRGRRLEKLGLRGQDTAEIFFEDCRIPATNLLGTEGQGFRMLMEGLQQERLVTAISALASCRRALDDTIAYVRQRHAFGQPVAAFQNTQFKLAELATEVELGQVFLDKLTAAHLGGEDVVTEVSMAKWWITTLLKRLTSECLQLHGGYGFMLEYPISTDYADAAVTTIGGGTNEIMKVIIARRMGLG